VALQRAHGTIQREPSGQLDHTPSVEAGGETPCIAPVDKYLELPHAICKGQVDVARVMASESHHGTGHRDAIQAQVFDTDRLPGESFDRLGDGKHYIWVCVH
jgi:hypothetical protein